MKIGINYAIKCEFTCILSFLQLPEKSKFIIIRREIEHYFANQTRKSDLFCLDDLAYSTQHILAVIILSSDFHDAYQIIHMLLKSAISNLHLQLLLNTCKLIHRDILEIILFCYNPNSNLESKIFGNKIRPMINHFSPSKNIPIITEAIISHNHKTLLNLAISNIDVAYTLRTLLTSQQMYPILCIEISIICLKDISTYLNELLNHMSITSSTTKTYSLNHVNSFNNNITEEMLFQHWLFGALHIDALSCGDNGTSSCEYRYIRIIIDTLEKEIYTILLNTLPCVSQIESCIPNYDTSVSDRIARWNSSFLRSLRIYSLMGNMFPSISLKPFSYDIISKTFSDRDQIKQTVANSIYDTSNNIHLSENYDEYQNDFLSGILMLDQVNVDNIVHLAIAIIYHISNISSSRQDRLLVSTPKEKKHNDYNYTKEYNIITGMLQYVVTTLLFNRLYLFGATESGLSSNQSHHSSNTASFSARHTSSYSVFYDAISGLNSTYEMQLINIYVNILFDANKNSFLTSHNGVQLDYFQYCKTMEFFIRVCFTFERFNPLRSIIANGINLHHVDIFFVVNKSLQYLSPSYIRIDMNSIMNYSQDKKTNSTYILQQVNCVVNILHKTLH